MDNHDVDRIRYLIEKLRAITLAAQIIPFVYSALYIFCMILYSTAPDNVLGVADTLFYVSPVIVTAFLAESKVLKLCKWHRRACCLPLIPQITVFIDWHICALGRLAAYIAVAVTALMSALLLIAAWNVFIKPKHNVRRKETPDRNSRLLQDEAAE